MTDAELAKSLAAQIPNPYRSDRWYPVKHNGIQRDAMIKQGRGAQSGRSYLHLRKHARTVLVNPATGERYMDGGSMYVFYRIRLGDPDAKLKRVG